MTAPLSYSLITIRYGYIYIYDIESQNIVTKIIIGNNKKTILKTRRKVVHNNVNQGNK